MPKFVDVTHNDQPVPDGSLLVYQDYGYDERGNYYKANAWFLVLNGEKIRFEMFKDTMLKYAQDYALEHHIETIYVRRAVEGR